MADHDAIAAYLKKAGLYDAIAAQAGIAKDSPDAADVHVSSTTGRGPGKKISTADIQVDADDEEAEKAKKPVAKEFGFTVTKIEPDKRQIFGWASISSVNGQEVIDKQGDIIPIDELEKAAYDFVLWSRQQGDMHEKRGVGRCIESVVFTPEKASVGITAKNENGEPQMGWWIGFLVDSDTTWEAHKAGKRPELSIGGRASSVQVAG